MYKSQDSDIRYILGKELERQQNELEMIASENYVSQEVLDSYSNVFTNKYSEGYPMARYYGGQERVDHLELLTQYKALKLFGLIGSKFPKIEDKNFVVSAKKYIDDNARGTNVQVLSGSPANLAVYMATLKPKDTVLAMDLSAGGHLSHGHPLSSSGHYYKFVGYGVDPETHLIDYDDIAEKAITCRPKIIIAGFSAYTRTIQWKKFEEIATMVEKKHKYRPILMADIAHISGLVAGKVIEGPFKRFDIVTTTTHKTLRGPRGALIFYRKRDNKEGTTIKRNGVDIDLHKAINRAVFPGLQGGPHMHTIVSKAIALEEASKADFKNYSEDVVKNARQLAADLLTHGWPVITGGTDNHMVLFDVTKRITAKEGAVKKVKGAKRLPETERIETGISGKIAEKVLEAIGISVNKNMIPFDQRSPMDPSGIRLGTPAITTRGIGKKDVSLIAEIITTALIHHDNQKIIEDLKKKIVAICKRFPLTYK